jgi:hypothetical protein
MTEKQTRKPLTRLKILGLGLLISAAVSLTTIALTALNHLT